MMHHYNDIITNRKDANIHTHTHTQAQFSDAINFFIYCLELYYKPVTNIMSVQTAI